MSFTHRQCLTGTNHVYRQQHIIGRLGDLTCAGGARVKDLLGAAHALKNGSRARESTCATTTHKGQGARGSGRDTTRHWGIHKVDAQPRCRFTDFARSRGVNRAGIEDQGFCGDIGQ